MRKIYKSAAVLTAAAALLTGCSAQEVSTDESSSIAEESVTSVPETTSTPEENSTPEETNSRSDFLNDLISSVRDKEPPESRPQNSGNGKLTILCWDSNYEAQNMADAFLEYKGYDSDKIEVVSLDVSNYQIYDEYKNYAAGDNDVDLFVISPDDISKFVYEESLTMPLNELGLSRADFPNAYEYTLDLCTNENGELRALCYNACPGAFVYRADLARQYLGVNSPEEMQELIGSCDSFQQTGTMLRATSGGKIALQSSVAGMLQAYICGKTQPWVMNGEKLTLGGCLDGVAQSSLAALLCLSGEAGRIGDSDGQRGLAVGALALVDAEQERAVAEVAVRIDFKLIGDQTRGERGGCADQDSLFRRFFHRKASKIQFYLLFYLR